MCVGGDGASGDNANPRAGTVEPLVYSVAEAAALLGISKDLAYDLIATGDLPSLRFGRRVVVPRSALRALVEA